MFRSDGGVCKKRGATAHETREQHGGGQRVHRRVVQRKSQRYGSVKQKIAHDVKKRTTICRPQRARHRAIDAVQKTIDKNHRERRFKLPKRDQRQREHANHPTNDRDAVGGEPHADASARHRAMRAREEREREAVEHGRSLVCAQYRTHSA